MKMSVSADGVSTDVPMTYDIKASGIKSGSPVYSAEMKMSMAGMTLTIPMYSDGKYVYMEMFGQKIKSSADDSDVDMKSFTDLVAKIQSEESFAGVTVTENEDGSKSMEIALKSADFNEAYGDLLDALLGSLGDELNGAGHYGNPQHTKENKDADGNVTGTLPYVAYGYTTAYPRDAYMGLFISELHFYARSWTQDGDETKTPRITAMTVVLTVAKRDADNRIVPLCTQKAIVQLPGEPVILYGPGTWDGKASSES